MNKTLVIALVVIILGLVGVWLYINRPYDPYTEPRHEVATLPGVPEGWKIEQGMEFWVGYPPEYTVNRGYTYQGLGPGKSIQGTSYTIPASYTEGTNLSSDTYLSVEFPSESITEGECDASRFIPSGASSRVVKEGGTLYTMVDMGDAGAGNRYEEIVYAITNSLPCVGIRYFIHSTLVENYEPGTVTAFDRDALIREFDIIRRSIQLPY